MWVCAALLVLVAGTAIGVVVVRHSEPTAQDPALLAAWTSGGLPDGFATRIAELDGVEATSVVAGDLVGLTSSWDAHDEVVDAPQKGFRIPLDALAVDARSYAEVLPARAGAPLSALQPGQALLGQRSARLRGLGTGAVLQLDSGERVTVSAVVDDDLVGHAELVLSASSPAVRTPRFVLLRHRGARRELEEAIGEAAGDRPVTVRGPDEVAALRHGGTVLPQVALKERFGEFSYRQAEGRAIVQNAEWVERHIRRATVPVLGTVTCHRALLPLLQGALREVAAAGLAHTVDPADYAGCYGPRLIAAGQGLSRHAWGAAVDFNATDNAVGAPPTLDPRLVDIMTRWGFTWGGEWALPDGMHFEYFSDPQ